MPKPLSGLASPVGSTALAPTAVPSAEDRMKTPPGLQALIDDGVIDILFVNETELATLTGEDDFEAGLATEIVETAGDLLAGEVVDGVADEIPGKSGDKTDHHDLKDPAADDRVVPGCHLYPMRGAECLDGHTLVPLLAAVNPHAIRPVLPPV